MINKVEFVSAVFNLGVFIVPIIFCGFYVSRIYEMFHVAHKNGYNVENSKRLKMMMRILAVIRVGLPLLIVSVIFKVSTGDMHILDGSLISSAALLVILYGILNSYKLRNETYNSTWE